MNSPKKGVNNIMNSPKKGETSMVVIDIAKLAPSIRGPNIDRRLNKKNTAIVRHIKGGLSKINNVKQYMNNGSSFGLLNDQKYLVAYLASIIRNAQRVQSNWTPPKNYKLPPGNEPTRWVMARASTNSKGNPWVSEVGYINSKLYIKGGRKGEMRILKGSLYIPNSKPEPIRFL